MGKQGGASGGGGFVGTVSLGKDIINENLSYNYNVGTDKKPRMANIFISKNNFNKLKEPTKKEVRTIFKKAIESVNKNYTPKQIRELQGFNGQKYYKERILTTAQNRIRRIVSGKGDYIDVGNLEVLF